MDFTINFAVINLLVVFAATVAANLLGALWYSPFLLGKPWRAASNKAAPSGEMSNPAGTFIAAFLLQFVAATMLAALLGPGSSGIEGARLGALLGFSFVFTALAITNLFERRPLVVIAINSGYHVTALCLVGFIVGQWS